MISIKNIGRVAGFLYLFISIIEILGPFSILYVPTDPAQAATVWLAISSVLEELVGRIEFVGGIWILLVSWTALRAGELPRALNYLGVVIGVAGILTVVPALDVLVTVFELGLFVWFVWFVWLGIAVFRNSPNAAARKLCRFFVVRFFAVSEVLRGQAGRRLGSGVQTGQRGESDVKP
ncbi:MAG: hypothetical protein M3392_02240 [Actinomycetota bacterium]|nr:hypothetical protein [Actinomycetota bacterium]